MDFRTVQLSKRANRAAERPAPEPLPLASTNSAQAIEHLEVPAPVPPRTAAELGLSTVFMRDILLKTLFRTNLETVSEIAQVLCVTRPICNELIDFARTQGQVETLGKNEHADINELRYQLTDTGRSRASLALEQSNYYGAIPVPLETFKAQARLQSVKDMSIRQETLTDSMAGIVINKTLLDKIGPAINSGRSILLYGPPGNGKSTLAKRIRDAMGDKIYVPRVLEYQGQVISFYDPVIHESAEMVTQDPSMLRMNNANFDQRYLLCKRPAVVTGGELRLDMLDLNYNSVSKTYQAPLQLKSTGGLFIVDDLGRQVESPQSIINRWITPMEEGEDILGMSSGEKFSVPFDTLVIFSTNFHPNEIFDGAALRRINDKIMVDAPSRDQMLQIYVSECRRRGYTMPEDVAIHLFTEKYPTVDNIYAAYHPGFLLNQIENICAYEGMNFRITTDLMDRAWDNLFVKDSIIAK